MNEYVFEKPVIITVKVHAGDLDTAKALLEDAVQNADLCDADTGTPNVRFLHLDSVGTVTTSVTRLNNFYCPECHQVLQRASESDLIPSICDRTGKDVFIRRVKDEEETQEETK